VRPLLLAAFAARFGLRLLRQDWSALDD